MSICSAKDHALRYTTSQVWHLRSQTAFAHLHPSRREKESCLLKVWTSFRRLPCLSRTRLHRVYIPWTIGPFSGLGRRPISSESAVSKTSAPEQDGTEKDWEWQKTVRFGDKNTAVDIRDMWLACSNEEKADPRKRLLFYDQLKRSGSLGHWQTIISIFHSTSYQHRIGTDYTFFILALCKTGQLEAAKDVFRGNLDVPNIFQFGAAEALIFALVKASWWRDAINIWESAFHYGHWLGDTKPGIRMGGRSLLLESLVEIIPTPDRYIARRLPAASSSDRIFLTHLTRQCILSRAHVKLHGKFLSLAEQIPYQPSVVEYTSVTDNLIRTRQYSTIIKMYEIVMQQEIIPNAVLFNHVLKAYEKLEDFEGMQSTFNHMFTVESLPGVYAYSLVMTLFARRGQADLVEELFDQFVGRGLKPNVYIYSALILARAVRREKAQGLAWFHLMQQEGIVADRVLYNIIIDILARNSSIDAALNMLSFLCQSGILPDGRTISTLMGFFARRGDVLAVEQLKRLYDQLGLPESPYILTSLITVYGRVKDYGKASETMASLAGKGLEYSTPVWNAMFTIFIGGNRMRDAKRTLQAMKKKHLRFDSISFALSMQLALLTDTSSSVLKILESMPASGFSPNSYHYCIAMVALLRAEKFDEVQSLYQRMLHSNVKPSFYVLSVLVHSCVNEGKEKSLEVAQNLIQSIRRTGMMDLTSRYESVFTLPAPVVSPVLSAYARQSNYEAGRQVLNSFMDETMEQSKMQWDIPLLCTAMTMTLPFVHSTILLELWNMAKAIADNMRLGYDIFKGTTNLLTIKSDLLCDIFSVYMKALTRDGESDRLEQTISSMLEAGYCLSCDNLNDLICYYCQNGRFSRACDLCEDNLLLQTSVESGFELFPATRRALLDASSNIEHTNIDEADDDARVQDSIAIPELEDKYPLLAQKLYGG